jgi:Zn-dependent M28 family amino/carboxypeptidase
MHRRLVAPISLSCAVLAASCASTPTAPSSAPVAAALQSIDAGAMLEHINALASDGFEGRSVGSRGGDVTVDYLTGEFKRIGLQPGNPDGTYVQRVPMTGHLSVAQATVTVGGQRFDLKVPDDLVAWSYRREAQVQVRQSGLVFIGYGVRAPEYDWDDYKDVDLHGKTVLVLINDPQVPDPQDPTRLDERLFKGKAMTYYGRWTYKYEEAAARGAAAVLIIHETATAAYPYQVVINSNSGENFEIRTTAPNPHFPPVPAWIHHDRARALLAAAGLDLDALKQSALRRDFRPVPLDATIDLTVTGQWRDLDAANVIGRIEGSDPKLKDEVVIYSAHWDHFGWNPKLPGSKHDQIFHGAADNASGVAALLELARAFKALAPAPRRTVLFMATTGEERGLLGAQYYASNPLYPLRTTLADINMDVMNTWGPTRDIEVVGWGNSDLDERLVQAAQSQGRSVRPDQNPELGFFYRADHFEFARVGVPALYTKRGLDYIGKPAGFGAESLAEYIGNDYHKVSDVVKPGWDLSGAVQDTQLLFLVGYEVAQADRYPQWKAGAEFKARRDAMLKAGP